MRRAATETRFSEIKLRAALKIAELSRELEKAKPGGAGGGSKTTSMSRSKTQQLAEVGINKRTAQRYEELAGPRETVRQVPA
jgi:hypothetical protein